jgi:hypothetical protein
VTGVAIPRARRRRRRPFGPREKWALMWLCIGVGCVCWDIYSVARDMASSDVNAWTLFDAAIAAFWVRRPIPRDWKVIRAWLDSGDDA